MKIIASKSEIGTILKDKVYKVPPFQRNFSWEHQQVEDIWDDIMNVTNNNSNNHFIGSMVFTPSKDNNSIIILDGQQRLATLLLLLAAIRDTLENATNNITKDKREKWIGKIKDVLYDEDIVTLIPNPKLELNRDDKQFFEELIINGNILDARRNSHKLIKDCYTFFKEQIDKKIKQCQDSEIFIKSILDTIFNKLLIIRIDVDNEIDAHMIFETLNDRGLALTASDLLKNYIFSLADNNNCLDLAYDSWKRVSDNVGDDKQNF